jgi:O-antigen/teichoic acid export membrane protein
VASTISKITYFFFGVLFSIIFNEFSFQKKTKSGFIYFYLFIIIFFSIFLFLTSDYIVYFLYDKKYETATSTVKYLIPAFALISLINILSNILYNSIACNPSPYTPGVYTPENSRDIPRNKFGNRTLRN